VNSYQQIWIVHSPLDLAAHITDPNEPVRAYQDLPRVGFRFKQKFELEFEIRFDPNLQKIISFDL
jgi:hypothetical protein